MKKLFHSFIGLICVSCLGSSQALSQIKLSADNIDEVISQLTIEEKVHLVIGTGMAGQDAKFPGTAGTTYAVERLGIPAVFMADGPHRLHMNVHRDWDSHFYYTTEFPSATTMASTWDPQASILVGKALGEEVRDYGLDILLAPGINLHRSALCGRNHEYYSEDPVIAGKLSAAYIKGLQSVGAGTCLKHFAVNNQETNRMANDSRVSQRALRELYLKGFEIAVKESQPWTIMTSYNKVNGKYTSENHDLTEKILRDEWGYKGMVMSDWNAGKDAVASMNAGNDMMQPGQPKQYEEILAAVKNGTISEATINRNVRRVLELVVKCYTFKGQQYNNEPDLKSHAALDRELGAQGMVLLQNENNALPFNVKTAALFGTTSYDIIAGGMGFGSTNHGYYAVSLIEGLRNAGVQVDKNLIALYKKHIAEQDKANYPNGMPPFSLTPIKRAEQPVLTDSLVEASVKANDIAIITLGRTCGEFADRTEDEFYLTELEMTTVKQVSAACRAAGKKVIVILNICSPVETASWRGLVDGILCAWQPGEQVGNCMADVLTGKVNPSGRLPMTWALKFGDAAADKNFPSNYKPDPMAFFAKPDPDAAPKAPEPNVDFTVYEEGIYMGYRYFTSFNKEVAFPFGFGLSYTSFDWNVENVSMVDDKVVVKVNVKNTGKVAGRDVVEIFTSAPKGKLHKPAKELKGFAKTSLLQPGTSETVTVEFNVMDMASFSEAQSSWTLDKGDYNILISRSVNDVVSSKSLKVAKARANKVHNAMSPEMKIKELKK